MIPRQNKRSACADENDSLGWTCGAAFSILGRTVGVRTDDQELLDSILDQLSPLGERVEDEDVAILYSLKKGGPGKRKGIRHYYVLYEGFSRLQRTFDEEAVVRELVGRWNAAVAGSLHMATLVAAPGIVMEKDGDALAVMGAPTGVALECLSRLQQDGYSEVSRRALVVNLDGKILPLPESLPDQDPADNSLHYKLKEIVFLEEDAASPSVVSPGQGAIKYLTACLGNATVWGELVGISRGFEGALCRIVPKNLGASAILGRD